MRNALGISIASNCFSVLVEGGLTVIVLETELIFSEYNLFIKTVLRGSTKAREISYVLNLRILC